MRRSNVIKIVLVIILIVLMIVTLGFYIVDLIINNTPPTKNLFRTLAIVFACLASIIRLSTNKGRRNLVSYESAYQKHIKDAFADRPFYRKKLLCAIRLYDEGKCDKAVRYLLDLKSVSQTSRWISSGSRWQGVSNVIRWYRFSSCFLFNYEAWY